MEAQEELEHPGHLDSRVHQVAQVLLENPDPPELLVLLVQ